MNIIQEKFDVAGSLAKRHTINTVVLHHAAADKCTLSDINWWHIKKGYSCVGYHYFIRKDGSIYKGRADDVIGAHAKGYNSTSIGVCFEGDYTKQVMPQAQLEAGRELVQYLKQTYAIKKVCKHKDLCSTSCPGDLFPFDEIVAQTEENLVLSFQRAAIADGFKFPKFGADGQFGNETLGVMKQCVVKKRLIHKYANATKLVQRLLCVEQDGKCGPITSQAIKDFQKQNGLDVDGAVGPKTWKKLLGIN